MNTHSLRHITVLSAQKAAITVPTLGGVGWRKLQFQKHPLEFMCCRIYCALLLRSRRRIPAQYVQNTPTPNHISPPFTITYPPRPVACTAYRCKCICNDLEQTVSCCFLRLWWAQSCRYDDSLSVQSNTTPVVLGYTQSFTNWCLWLQDFNPDVIPT